MGATKMDFYTDDQIEMANLCKALGHPARIAVMEKLIENEDYNFKDLQSFVGLAQSTVSRHLKELFSVGLIGYRVVGSSSFYYISSKVVKQIAVYLTEIHSRIKEIIEYLSVYFKPRLKHNLPYFMQT